MKEIGGYLEIEHYNGKEFYDYLTFSSSRNSLRFIVRSRKIKKIYLPYYLCSVVKEALMKEKVEIIYYHINESFEPIIDNYDGKSYVYIVNYFGLLSGDDIFKIKAKYNNIILDNTHSFFMQGFDYIDTIYNCRKYFGVPDGSYLYTKLLLDSDYKETKSINRIKHIFGRYEENANMYYNDFLKADESFANGDIELMSKITHNLLRSIDYKYVEDKRKDNFNYLNNKLSNINGIKTDEGKNCTFMYPLLVENGNIIKQMLNKNKIYIPTLWPELQNISLNEFEKRLLNDLVLLPIDQRYDFDDMEFILDTIYKIQMEVL